MRLIDADELIEELKKRVKTKRSTMEILRDIIPMIENQPTAEESWNPANEPPDNDRVILVSFKDYYMPIPGYYMRCINREGEYCSLQNGRPFQKSALTANGWMELPECKRDV
jgi:hypothetical protein